MLTRASLFRSAFADEEGENALKIILLGDSAVGKSKLVERFLVRCGGRKKYGGWYHSPLLTRCAPFSCHRCKTISRACCLPMR